MISNELIQQTIISKLKADTPLVNYLTNQSATNEIREAQWQGAQFVYPAVRVQAGGQLPDGNLGSCHTSRSETTITITSHSESDSSREADVLMGLVNAAIFGKRLSGTGFRSMLVDSDSLLKATRENNRVWRGTGLYRVKLYET